MIPIQNYIVYCFKNRNLVGTVLPLHPSPSIENTVTIKHTQDGLSLRLLSLIHISIPNVYILGLFLLSLLFIEPFGHSYTAHP